MTDIAIILALVLAIVCVACASAHAVAIGRVTLVDWAVLSIGGVYGAGWALVAFVTEHGGNPQWERWLLPFKFLYPFHTLLAFVLMGALWAGWYLMGSRLSLGRSHSTSLRHIHRRLQICMWTLLTVAVAMQWLYAHAYGGFVGLLAQSALIRSGIFQIDNPFSFLKPFGGLALFASFGFYGLWLGGARRFSTAFGFVVSLLFSAFVLYSWLGRIAFMVFIATFIVGKSLFRQPRPLPLMLKGVAAMGLILVGAYGLSVWVSIESTSTLWEFMARELSFLFGSFFAQLDAGDQFRAFRDFLFAPLYLLPSSVWSQWVDNVGQINTALIQGAEKGQSGVTGAIPVDVITLGIMQLGALGVVGCGMLLGALLRCVQWLLDRITHAGVRAVLEGYVALKVAVLGLFYAHPLSFVESNFALFVTACALVLTLGFGRRSVSIARSATSYALH